MSRSEVCALANISEASLYNYEQGKRDPKGKDIVELAKALKTTVAYIFGETDDPSPDALKSLNDYQTEVHEIKTARFYGSIDYGEAELMGMSEDDIKRHLAEANKRIEQIELERAAERLQKALLAKQKIKVLEVGKKK